MDQQESALQMCVCSRHRVNKTRAKVRHIQGALGETAGGSQRREPSGGGSGELGGQRMGRPALWEDYFAKVSLEERVPGE